MVTRYWPLLLLCLSAGAETRWERSAARKRELAKDVVRLTHKPQAFLMRRGDHFDDEVAR